MRDTDPPAASHGLRPPTRLPQPLSIPPAQGSRRRFVRDLSVLLAAGAAAPLAACVREPSGPTGPIGISPSLSARPGTPTGSAPLGTSQLALGFGRDGVLYVPTDYDGSTAIPLLVAFHGAASAGTAWAPLFDVAEAQGFAVLAPDSRGQTWDLAGTGRFGADVTFINTALAQVFSRVRIEPTRIAFLGFSDGASYALSLGVSNGDLVSHLIGVAPGFFAPADPIVGKPDIWLAHGTDDTVLPLAFTRDTLTPALQNAGYIVTFTSFEGGHSIPDEVGDAAIAWWFS